MYKEGWIGWLTPPPSPQFKRTKTYKKCFMVEIEPSTQIKANVAFFYVVALLVFLV